MRSSNRRLVLAGVLAMTLALAGCIPEANRERGGGPGGDPGNWSDPINMHGQEHGRDRMYYQTPAKGLGIERSGSAEGIEPEP